MLLRVGVGGGTIACEREGEGFPLLLLHGWLRSRQEWQALRPFLPGHLVVPDLPGAGESDIPTANYDLPFYVRKMVGLMDALGIRRFGVVGHGLGGAIAVQMAHEQRERVRSLVLLSASTWPNPVLDRRAAIVRGPLGNSYFRYVFNRERCRLLMVRRHYADPSRVDDAVLEAVFRPLCRKGARIALHRSLSAAFNPQIGPQLETGTVPTLAIWGQNDQVHPVAMGERLAREKPNTRLVVLPGGDYMALESQAREVGAQVRRWGLPVGDSAR